MGPEATTAAETSPWRPIAIGDWAAPEQVTTEGLVRAWRWLWKHSHPDDDGGLQEAEPVPADEVAHLVPALDLEAAAARLAPDLESWLERAPEAPRSIVLVGPPGSAVQDVLRTWARGAEAVCVDAPTPVELGDGRWDPALPDDLRRPLVLPPLERLFLRRSGGLDLLRDLLERLQSEGRAFAAACDGWGWSFLRRTLPGRAGFDRVLAPAPFTGVVLRSWLSRLDPTFVFVDARAGAPLLAPGEDAHEFLRSLAARARGIPNVAAGLWRAALCSARLGAPQDGVRRCMIPRWQDVSAPELPPQIGKPGALLLHALLLHGGLDERVLTTVLPIAAAEARTLLWDLSGRGVTEESDGAWRVSAAGYPAARSHLAALNLPLDDF